MMWVHRLVQVMWLSPLLATIGVMALQYRLRAQWAHRMVLAGLGVSLLCAWWLMGLFFYHKMAPFQGALYQWFEYGSLSVQVGYDIDALSVQMASMTTFVSFMVAIFSVGYMHEEPGYAHFFAYIALFVFMMLSLVLADNLIVLFFGWEGMGLVSYLLIGFYMQKPKAADSALMAFMINRLGDMGLAVGVAGCYFAAGSVVHKTILQAVGSMAQESFPLYGDQVVWLLPCIGVAWFVGVMAKSAQMPLHGWLPGSMEGPTPISALIHAATMVTAGVYLVCRFSPMYAEMPVVSEIMALVGASGALWLGIVGAYQMDIKRVVAYSTLSQLGYMVVALGVGAYRYAALHLLTHAYFKSLLFLATGSIKMITHTQDIRKMGGLAKTHPVLMACYLCGALALCGMPPFSGFFSKEPILLASEIRLGSQFGSWYVQSAVLLGVGVTAFYIFRVFWAVFFGGGNRVLDPIKSERTNFWCYGPLLALSVPACVSGFMVYAAVGEGRFFQGLLASTLQGQGLLSKKEAFSSASSLLWHTIEAPWALGLMLLGVAGSYWLFGRSRKPDAPLVQLKGASVFNGAFGFETMYYALVASFRALGTAGIQRFEQQLLDSFVETGVGGGTLLLAEKARSVQNGRLRRYMAWLLLGLCAVVLWMLGVWVLG